MKRARWGFLADMFAPWRRFFSVVSVTSLTVISAPALADSNGYPIGAGDLLQILVYGGENVSGVLSGRFRVEPDGTINYPLLGSLPVSGKSTAEVGRQLRAALSNRVPISIPTVTVVEFAPVFLLGDVTKPGPIQFQPNMTVLQLLLLAGGVAYPAESLDRRLSLAQEISDIQLANFSLSVQRTRLRSEIRNEDFDGDAFLQDATEEMASIIGNEVALFGVHQRARASLRKGYQAQRDTYDREIRSLEESITLHDEEVRLLEEQVAIQKGLTERGLAVNSALMELQRQLTSTRRTALEFRTALFRAQQNRLAVEQKLAEGEIDTETKNLETLLEAELNLFRNQLKLASYGNALAGFLTGDGVAANVLGARPQYTLFRSTGSGNKASVANELTKLERGDIVRVDLVSADPSRATSLQVSVSEAAKLSD